MPEKRHRAQVPMGLLTFFRYTAQVYQDPVNGRSGVFGECAREIVPLDMTSEPGSGEVVYMLTLQI